MSEAKEINVTVEKNPFALTNSRQESGGMIQVASSRQAQEVQAAMVLAKRFPRDEELAYTRIMTACQRKGLAEAALYSYPRGGIQITGPSIRLAEAIAQRWGNLDFGVVELEQRNGESTVMAYCVDLETNTRETKIFQVPHERKAGQTIKKLDDPRDVYELVANSGARRLRACILGIVPGDIVDAAIVACEQTLKKDQAPLIDRIRLMATKFIEDLQVSVAMLEKRLAHKLDATNEQELVGLRKIYTSLRDGASKREDWFEMNPAQSPEFEQQPSSTVPHQELGATPKRRKKADPAAQPTEGQPQQPQTPVQEAKLVVATDESRNQSRETPPAQGRTGGSNSPTGATQSQQPTRADLIAEARTRLQNLGISESELLAVMIRHEDCPAGTGSLAQLPTPTLLAMLEPETWKMLTTEASS